jgi:dihydroorotate dehydrogenase (fumarate)
MIDLSVKYLGLNLKNPVIVGANNMVKNLSTIKKWEIEGAAAIVYKSLFEEQIQLEKFVFDERLNEYNERNAEMISLFPNIQHSGPKEHIMNIKAVKQNLNIPIIASLNCVKIETWIEYAKILEETGVDALELNFYFIPLSFEANPDEIENQQINVFKEVKNNVKIPVSVKLSPFYTNPLNFIKKLDEAGPDGIVIFNRFFQPDIDIYNEKHFFPYDLSAQSDNKLALRFSGMLFGQINADICANNGIYDGDDIIKLILAGAGAVQIVSTLYKHQNNIIPDLLEKLETWMAKKNYQKINDFRGKLSQKSLNDPFAYKRAQYIDIIMNSENIFKKFPIV